MVARWAHNPKAVGSNPTSATSGESPHPISRLAFVGREFFYRGGVPPLSVHALIQYLSCLFCAKYRAKGLRCEFFTNLKE